MNIEGVQRQLSRIEEIAVIGKNAEVEGVICHVMGVVRYGSRIRLLILQYDEAFSRRIEEAKAADFNDIPAKPENNRMLMRGNLKYDAANPFRAVCKVSLGEREFAVHCSENRRLNSQDYEYILLLSEFLRQGWQPDGIEYQSLDHLFITSLELEGEYQAIPVFGPNPLLRFSLGTESISYLVEQPLTLYIGYDYPDKLWFRNAESGEKHWVQINRVYLSDMWAEMAKTFADPKIRESMTPEQIAQAKADFEERFSEICPRGMYFPIVEYECEEGIFLEFCSKAYLDAAPVRRSSAIGFIASPEQATGILGLKLKAAVIMEPVPAKTASIEAELFRYSVITKKDDIVLDLDTPPAFHLRSHQPGDMGWVTHRHGVLYAREYGWDERFEALVGQISADFINNYKPGRERSIIAELKGEIVGSVFVVQESDTVAKLRLLLVEPKARGLGLGSRLVQECISFARSAGYRKLILWTNSVLKEARHIYGKAGFKLVKQENHHSFGKDLIGETWELLL